jgi:phosphomannomutase/phosphoglucomutase
MNIFKAYDIRGIYGEDITDEIALDLGKSLGTFLKGKGNVCIGYDTRPSSINLFKNFVSGLTSTGCNVVSLGMVPNPIAYFFAWKNKIYGCHVTASHNPVDWNGFKLIKPNGVTFIDEYKTLESILRSKKFITGKKGNVIEEKNAINEYVNFLKSKFGKLNGKIIVDFLGGAGIRSLEVLKKLGLDVIPLHEKPDASLYGFHRLESWGDLLNTAMETVKKEKADFGVAFDADADRSIFINSAGEYMDPSVMHGIFTKNILKGKKGKIIATFDSATELEKLSKDIGGKLIWSRIGHNFIEQKILDENALFAGEQSSHYYFNEFYPFSDGVLTTLKLCKILNETKRSFDDFIKEIKFHPVVKLYIEAGTDEKKIEVVEKLRNKHPDSIDIADGFKFKLNEVEWVIIRGSQTLPEINLCIEALNEKRMKELVQKYSDIIKKEL